MPTNQPNICQLANMSKKFWDYHAPKNSLKIKILQKISIFNPSLMFFCYLLRICFALWSFAFVFCILQRVSPSVPLLPTDHPPFLTSFEQSPPLIKNSAQTKLANTELIEHKNSFLNTNPSSVCEICNILISTWYRNASISVPRWNNGEML